MSSIGKRDLDEGLIEVKDRILDKTEKILKDTEIILAKFRQSLDYELRTGLEKFQEYEEVMELESHMALIWYVIKIILMWELGNNKMIHIQKTQKLIDDYQVDEKKTITENLKIHGKIHEKMNLLTKSTDNDNTRLSQLLMKFGRDKCSSKYYE